jgi:hypothetical protein
MGAASAQLARQPRGMNACHEREKPRHGGGLSLVLAGNPLQETMDDRVKPGHD